MCSCSFKPLSNAQKAKYNHNLSKIHIEPINTIAGSEYYEVLSDLLNPSSNTEYVLITTLNFTKGIAVLLPNSDVSHEKIIALVNYRLVSTETGKEITSGNITKSLSYSTTFAPYVSNARAEDATLNLARNIAEEVRNRLLFYFISTHENI